MIEDLLDPDLPPACPSCGYPGYEFDAEFKAWVHDLCGYWMDEEPVDAWVL